MEKKHGELKIMYVSEMIEMFIENIRNGNAVGMDFATLEFRKEDLRGVPARYLDLEKVYADAWGWNGIRVMNDPFDTDDIIVAVGHYGSTLRDAFPICLDYYGDWDDDFRGATERLFKAVYSCDDGDIRADDTVIVELHDDVYKRAEEDEKIEQTLKEATKKFSA